MMKVLVDYPTEDEEFVIVQRVTGAPVDVTAVATTEQLAALQAECRRVYVDPSLIQYAVKLVAATRTPEKAGLKDLARFITFGASPRATINLTEGARALALLRGRSYALPEDMTDLVPDVLRHRLVLSYEALSEGLSADAVIGKIMAKDPGARQAAGTRKARRLTWSSETRFAGKAPQNRRNLNPSGLTLRRARPAAPNGCCAGWNGRSSAGSTACCRATTAR